jgi:hypothetical protein
MYQAIKAAILAEQKGMKGSTETDFTDSQKPTAESAL